MSNVPLQYYFGWSMILELCPDLCFPSCSMTPGHTLLIANKFLMLIFDQSTLLHNVIRMCCNSNFFAIPFQSGKQNGKICEVKK